LGFGTALWMKVAMQTKPLPSYDELLAEVKTLHGLVAELTYDSRP
jgi:hypothetical protein